MLISNRDLKSHLIISKRHILTWKCISGYKYRGTHPQKSTHTHTHSRARMYVCIYVCMYEFIQLLHDWLRQGQFFISLKVHWLTKILLWNATKWDLFFYKTTLRILQFLNPIVKKSATNTYDELFGPLLHFEKNLNGYKLFSYLWKRLLNSKSCKVNLWVDLGILSKKL